MSSQSWQQQAPGQQGLWQHVPSQPQYQQQATMGQQYNPAIQSAPPVFQHPPMCSGQQGGSGIGADNHTSTVTTTTTTSSHARNVNSNNSPASLGPLTQLTGHMQSLQMQQSPPYQSQPSFQQQVQSPPPPQIPPQQQAQPPPMLELPPPQSAPTFAASLQQQQVVPQHPPPVQSHNPQYPVTVEQRQQAWSVWLSQNAGKPQRTKDRTMNEFLSGLKDKQVYETLVQQQQTQQAQITLQIQQSNNAVQAQQAEEERRQRREVADHQRQQRTLERQQKKAAEEEQRRQDLQDRQREQQQQRTMMSQQHLMQQEAPGGYGATNTTTSTTDVTQTIMQQGSNAGAGEHRRQAISEGPDAVRRLDQRIQAMFLRCRPCPMGFVWIPLPNGYRCGGGTHFVSDLEIDKMLRIPGYQPNVIWYNGMVSPFMMRGPGGFNPWGI
ncbi:hypothetical protein LTR37_012311 [Vermiconidia calcicola]|uniref:Uncharacterized protein n=1 Tax=Vermiconidia calcicola TaxID=1690605 RepID=A0ACC3MZU1_9PEZI|nr:hypothetical protein LTR37_012311 [Vermiconidia calcicola]